MSTPEQRLKWKLAKRAEIAAKKAEVKTRKPRASGGQREAIIFLKHAEREISREIRTGKRKKLGRSALLTLLALDVLQGDNHA